MKTFDINKIQLSIESPDFTISKTLGNYILSKIEKLGNTYGRLEKCNVVVRELKSDVSKSFEVTAEIFIPGYALFASEKTENPRLSVKLTFDDLRKQLVRLKEKLEDKKSIQLI